MKAKSRQKLKIKQLIEINSIIPNPYYLLIDILLGEFPSGQKLNRFRRGIGKVNSELLAGDGYDGVEFGLWGGGLFDGDWDICRPRLKRYQAADLPIQSFHACLELFPETYKNRYLNLADGAKLNSKAVKSHIEIASLLGGPGSILVFHPGYVADESDVERGINNVARALGPNLAEAAKRGIIVTVENLFWNSSRRMIGREPAELLKIIDIAGSDLEVTFDWGHANTWAQKNKVGAKTFGHIDRVIDELGPRIRHAHLHYNFCHLHSPKPKRGWGWHLIEYLMAWSQAVQFDKRNIDDQYDFHVPFHQIDGPSVEKYRATLSRLLERSSIQETGLVTLEILPKKVFGWLEIAEYGLAGTDHQKNLRIARQWLKTG